MAESQLARFEWFEAYVGECLGARLEGVVPPRDEDGDWVLGWESSAMYVSACSEPQWCADVWAVAARGIRPRVAVLREINELNMRMSTAMAVLMPGGSVMIRQRLIAQAVNAETLEQAVMMVGYAAEKVGVTMAGMFDGYEPFAAQLSSEDAS